MLEMQAAFSQKYNVWGSIIVSHIIGSIFVDGNLTNRKYLNMIREEVVLSSTT